MYTKEVFQICRVYIFIDKRSIQEDEKSSYVLFCFVLFCFVFTVFYNLEVDAIPGFQITSCSLPLQRFKVNKRWSRWPSVDFLQWAFPRHCILPLSTTLHYTHSPVHFLLYMFWAGYRMKMLEKHRDSKLIASIPVNCLFFFNKHFISE